METIIQEIHVERQRKPEWLKARVPGGENYSRLKTLIPEYGRMLEFRNRNVHDPW
jgi:lipoate synthase